MEHIYKHLTSEQLETIGRWEAEDWDMENLVYITIHMKNIANWLKNVSVAMSMNLEIVKSDNVILFIAYPGPK